MPAVFLELGSRTAGLGPALRGRQSCGGSFFVVLSPPGEAGPVFRNGKGLAQVGTRGRQVEVGRRERTKKVRRGEVDGARAWPRGNQDLVQGDVSGGAVVCAGPEGTVGRAGQKEVEGRRTQGQPGSIVGKEREHSRN